MDGILLEVLSFDGQILKEDQINTVTLQTVDGPINVLKQHAPLMTALDVGVLKYVKANGEEGYVSLGTNGFAEIYRNHISVIVSTAETQDSIDVLRANRAKERLEGLLSKGVTHTDDGLLAEIALKKALSRISCSEGRCRL